MEDNLKILNVEYLSNHWSDLIQFLNLSQGDKTKVYRSLKLKMTPTEDNLKILNVEYFSNHWSDLIQILNLRQKTKFIYWALRFYNIVLRGDI
jgi:hypothetical protein